MKKIRLILIVILWFFLLIPNICCYAITETKEYTLSFSESDFVFSINENNELEIGSKKLNIYYPESEVPALPVVTSSIAISGGGKYVSSSLSVDKRLIRTNAFVSNSPIVLPTNETTYYHVAKPHSYANGIYPASNFEYSGSIDWSNVSIIHFNVCPFIFDSDKKELYFIDKIKVTVKLEVYGVVSENQIICTDNAFLKSLVINDDFFETYNQRKVSINEDKDKVDYLIITSNSLKDSFIPLINWKKRKGLYCKILTISEICDKYSGKDVQEKIKRCLYDLYIHHSLKFVMLGGDDTVIPVRGCYGKVDGTSRVYIDNTIPTDLYYACFEGSFEWDENNNGIYGELEDNVNLAQSVYITRLPIRTSEEINNFISKILDYESNLKWNNNILMSGALLNSELEENHSDAETLSEILYNQSIQPYWEGERVRFFDTYTDFSGGASFSLNPENLNSIMSEGYMFMDMNTHGEQNRWCLEDGSYYVYNINDIKNSSHILITTNACKTNAFDLSTEGGKSDPCLSESFIRSQRSGVIAYLGCSRYGWFSAGSFSLGSSMKYTSKFYEYLFSNPSDEKNFGTIVSLAKQSLTGQCNYYGSMRWVQFGLNPIGAPEMPIFINEPKRFSRSELTCQDTGIILNSGVSNCRICVMSLDDNGENYYKVFYETNKIALTSLPEFSNICISKQGYYPKEYKVCTIQNELIQANKKYEGDVVQMGSNVTTYKQHGGVCFDGVKIDIQAGEFVMHGNVSILSGSNFEVWNK